MWDLPPFAWIVAYVAIVNLSVFAAFGDDKRRARSGTRRIPERTLLLLAVLGGGPAALLASHVFRHKTRKQPFRTLLWTTALAQAAVLIALVLYGRR